MTPLTEAHRIGFCYVLTHMQMPGICKVGSTRKHPIQRATELSAGTGVPGQFTVSYHRAFTDCFEAERLCHQHFAADRVDPAREFFATPLPDVVEYIRALGRTLPGSGEEGGDWIDKGLGVRNPVASMALPYSELFATFPDDGSARELTEEEQAKCRALSARP